VIAHDARSVIQARLHVCARELWVLLKHVLNRIASREEFQNGLNRDAGATNHRAPIANIRFEWNAFRHGATLPWLPANPKKKWKGNTLLFIADRRAVDYYHYMTAVAEIQSAIEKLSPAEVKELAAWLDEYQQMINASAEMFSLYDKEEKAKP